MNALESELKFAQALAREAARIARERHSLVKAQEKSNNSFVTDLDLDLERLIRDRIGAAFPDDALKGEEYAAGGGCGPRCWCIDPIDGTGNLVHGMPLWSISIGLLDEGEPVLGVIAIPPVEELFWATKGGGAWRDGTRIEANDSASYHDHENVSISTNALRVIDPRSIPGRIRDIGSACCELAFVASGRFRASIFLGEQAHDVAAGSIIAAEAGCEFRMLDGQVLSAREFVARTPIVSPTIIAPPGRALGMQRRLRRLDARHG